MFPTTRLRRMRKTPALRSMMSDTHLRLEHFIQPLFVVAGSGIRNDIASMPGQQQLSIDQLHDEVLRLQDAGVRHVMLFGIPASKDGVGSDATSSDGIIAKAIAAIKEQAPELTVVADTCFCEYTDHGHCGLLNQQRVDNDATLLALGKQAVIQAQAGADMIAPSGMMDGMVQAIRQALDEANFSDLPIMSYAVKYASSFYGPFRDAANGAPQFGDRRDYQMSYANKFECLREAELDVAEGADIIMVKPALAYCDVINRIAEHMPEVPLAAYQVSAEYSMIKAAAANGWVDEQAMVVETLTAIKRAGANIIISYYAKNLHQWI